MELRIQNGSDATTTQTAAKPEKNTRKSFNLFPSSKFYQQSTYFTSISG